MKKNSMGKYREDKPSDEYETVVDADTGATVYEATPNLSEKYKEMIAWAENRRGSQFLLQMLKKQYKAFKIARENNINPSDLKNRWVEFEDDSFRKRVGFDWMDVVLSFNKKR